MADAWAKWSGSDHTVLRTIRGGGDLTGRLARLLHQASFLTCTVRNRTALGWRAAAGWLVRACSTYETGRNRSVDDADMGIPDWDSGGLENCVEIGASECMVPTWTTKCNGECERCAAARIPRRLRGSALPNHKRHVARPGSGGQLRAVARHRASAGIAMATVYATSSTARSQVATAGWWPRPRRVPEGDNNAEWVVQRCPECSE